MRDPNLRSATARRRPTRLRLLAVFAALSLSRCICGDDDLQQLPDPQDQIDIFEQRSQAKVDILWVIDNSESMFQEQAKVSNGFSAFFGQLLGSRVDYHIGVITTDPDDAGKLRTYTGPSVGGCNGCKFLTNAVDCDDPNVDVSNLNDADAEAELRQNCEAQLVFRKLVSAGTGGNPFEEGFAQAARALGADIIDPETGRPTGDVPEENEGFLRDGASLYIIFVSDEDEGAKADGSPIIYYHRLFEGLKPPGDELKVSVSAIVGWPQEDKWPDIEDVCEILETTFDDNATTDDPRANTVQEALTTETECIDIEEGEDDPITRAETGSRYLELACRTGGVVTNLCDREYTTALDELGANAAGLLRKFFISKPGEIEGGKDCELFTPDDVLLDCNEDGDEDDEGVDGPICVKGVPLGGNGEVLLVPRSESGGWTYEPSQGAIRFGGAFIPAPDTEVEVFYRLVEQNSECKK